MKRRPLLAVAISTLVCSATLMQHSWLLDWRVFCLLLAFIALLTWRSRKRWIPIYLLCGLLFAINICYHLSPEPPTNIHSRDVRARCEGTVIRFIGANSRLMLIKGEVDTRLTRAFACTVLVNTYGKRPEICDVGSRVVLYGFLRRPKAATLPGEFNEARWMASMNVPVIISTTPKQLWVVSQPFSLWRFVTELRSWAKLSLEKTFSGPAKGVVTAMVLGDRTNLDAADRLLLSNTGTAHVIAVSGAHVGLIVLIIGSLFGNTFQSRGKTSALILLITSFVFFSGASPPSVRAGLMVAFYLAGRKVQFDVDPLNILGAVVLIELIVWPTLIVNVSFIMSTIATAGILWLYAPINEWLTTLIPVGRIRSVLASPLSLSISASTSVALPSGIIFKTLPLLSVLSNLIVVPLFMTTMCSGLLSLTLCMVSEDLAAVVALPGMVSCQAALSILEFIHAVQPSVSSTTVVAIGVLYTAGTIWMQQQSTWGAVVLRGIIAAVLVTGSAHVFDRQILGVWCIRDVRGLNLKVQGSQHPSIPFSIRSKKGAVFVRSRNAIRPDSPS